MARRKVTTTQPDMLPIKQGATQAPITPQSRSLVFVSHDSRDAELAEAFSNLLSDVSGGTLKSFRSSDRKGTGGIEFGADWYKAIMSKLEDATDVVALLTSRSIDRPWILYEAGVAKGKLDATVFGIAVGVPLERVSTGPFAQFQNCGADEDSLTKLILQLIRRNPDADPRAEAVRRQVKAFLDNLAVLLATDPKGAKEKPDAEVIENNIAKLFEEVKAMVRQLPDKVEERVKIAAQRGGRSRGRRIHPGMLEEMLFHPAIIETPDGPATSWLIFISMLRDDIPWLYEPGLEVYRALRSRNPRKISAARSAFHGFLKAFFNGPFYREMRFTSDDQLHVITHNLPDMFEAFLSRLGPLQKQETATRKMDVTKGKG
jgi:ElaB/YqjD/DUF883 family membrane-anchored ribosome-binding protein